MRRLRRRVVRHVGRPPQQRHGIHGLAIQWQSPLFTAVEIQNVVDQAHQPVAVSDRHFDHLALLLRPLVQRAALNQSQRSTQRGQRRLQFVAYRGDELVFHLLQAPPLAHVLERHHHAANLAFFKQRSGAVFDRNRRPVLAPEHFVPHADRLATPQRLQNRAGRSRIRSPVGVAVMDQLMQIAAHQLIGRRIPAFWRRPR